MPLVLSFSFNSSGITSPAWTIVMSCCRRETRTGTSRLDSPSLAPHHRVAQLYKPALLLSPSSCIGVTVKATATVGRRRETRIGRSRDGNGCTAAVALIRRHDWGLAGEGKQHWVELVAVERKPALVSWDGGHRQAPSAC